LPERECGEIEEHVETCRRCQESLDGLTSSRAKNFPAFPPVLPISPELNGKTTTPLTADPPDPAFPVVPGYEILRELGRGGVGVVYLARQLHPPRLVAFKTLQPGREWVPRDRARFRTEAESLALLQHPNIIPVYEVGEFGDRPFFTMEYLGGGDLHTRLVGRDLPLREAALLVETLAQAIHHAHQRGVIHRDLKPANVLLADPSAAPLAAGLKITDFGLAKCATEDAQRTCLTTEGLPHGTAGYMAPEQAGGRLSEVSVATDVYALGAILYRLMTGRIPFEGAPALEIILKTQSDTESPPRPSAVRPEARGDLEVICMKCLEKEPARRYASAAEMADDLRRFLENRPIRARPTPAWRRLGKWSRRKPSAAVLLVLAALSPVALVAFAQTFAHGVRKARAEELRNTLFSAEAVRLAPIVRQLREDLWFVRDGLRETAVDQRAPGNARLRAALVLAPSDQESARYLQARIPDVSPAEIHLICEALDQRREAAVPGLTAIFHNAEADLGKRLRAACALAQLAPEAEFWREAGGAAAELLVAETPLTALGWAPLLEPVKSALVPPVKGVFADPAKTPAIRRVAAALLAEYCAADLPALVGFLREADAQQFLSFFDKLRAEPSAAIPLLQERLGEQPPAQAAEEVKERFALSQANLSIALLRLGVSRPAMDRLRAGPDPRLRYRLLGNMRPCRVHPAALAEELRATADDAVRYALLLALGDYHPDEMGSTLRADLTREVGRLLHASPDAGVHSASGWLLRRWNGARQSRQSLREAIARNARWYTAAEEHTLAIIVPPAEARVPAPRRRDGTGQDAAKERRGAAGLPVKVSPFAIATCEVTIAQYRRFAADQIAKGTVSSEHLGQSATERQPPPGAVGLEPSCPVSDISFARAALYCNWLSEREGLPASEWCYDIALREGAPNAIVTAAFHDRSGYRLPTEAEWVYACRAGTTTAWFFGERPDQISEYAWHYANSDGRPWSVGRKRPNPLGLFDVHGNVSEWCARSWDDVPRQHEILMGGGWRQRVPVHRSDVRTPTHRSAPNDTFGFRVARTLAGRLGAHVRSAEGASRVGVLDRVDLKPKGR
jgi:serine/threonine protein kinase/formylglycine-generating enzyme required for sulfatase activity